MDQAKTHLKKNDTARVKVMSMIEEKKQSLNEGDEGELSEEEAHEGE